MANVKFMDISETNNPSSEDSVLIANDSNGVKRTKLSNLKGAVLPHGLFAMQGVAANLSKPDTGTSNQYTLTAPDVEGYKFQFWIAPQLTYVAGYATTNQPAKQSATFFANITSGSAASNSEIVGYAVYVLKDLA